MLLLEIALEQYSQITVAVGVFEGAGKSPGIVCIFLFFENIGSFIRT
jgi:hypothetical protein